MELNKNDLTNLLAIIDMSTQRGVFKGSDLAPVGQLYEKIKTLLETENKENNNTN
jgi:hypothetical protein